MNKIAAPGSLMPTSADEDARELRSAAGLLYLAILGSNAMIEDECPGEWHGEAMEWGGRLLHDLAERLAARLGEDRTRWMVPVGYGRYDGETEPEAAGARTEDR